VGAADSAERDYLGEASSTCSRKQVTARGMSRRRKTTRSMGLSGQRPGNRDAPAPEPGGPGQIRPPGARACRSISMMGTSASGAAATHPRRRMTSKPHPVYQGKSGVHDLHLEVIIQVIQAEAH